MCTSINIKCSVWSDIFYSQLVHEHVGTDNAQRPYNRNLHTQLLGTSWCSLYFVRTTCQVKDDPTKQAVRTEEGQDKAQEWGAQYIETSAVTGEGTFFFRSSSVLLPFFFLGSSIDARSD